MRLMRNRKSKEMVAVKYVEREAGAGLSKNTEREIINHRKLLHENIIRFHEVCHFFVSTTLRHPSALLMPLRNRRGNHVAEVAYISQVYVTDKHLAIVMEYASGGTLGQRIDETGPFPEEKAKELFLQLIAGIDYCHGLGYASASPFPAATYTHSAGFCTCTQLN